MSVIKLLVVDDSVVIRKILTDSLSAAPDIEIAGIAANGKIALQKISQCNPDIVTLDIEMPEMDGITTLKEIRKIHPQLPVIMFSALTERGASATLEALACGASDYCTKPTNVGSASLVREQLFTEMLGKIRALCSTTEISSNQSDSAISENKLNTLSKMPSNVTPAKKASRNIKPQILVIGVSTGGPNALAELIPALPEDLGVPLMCVQHMPPVFTKMLAERLNLNSKITVVEAESGMILEENTMYIAPGDYHMILERAGSDYQIVTNQDPRENSCRPAVDPLFRSVVEYFGASTLGLVLTGMGSDGLIGCEYITEAGGKVIVQDKSTSVVWGMPGYVAEAGLAESVLPLDKIADEIIMSLDMKGMSSGLH